MKYSYDGNKLTIGDKTIIYRSPIKDVLEISSVFLVLLQRIGINVDISESMNRNLYAYSHSGVELWQIQEAPSDGDKDRPYTAVYKEDGGVIAYNGLGMEYKLDLTDGNVEVIGGRPW